MQTRRLALAAAIVSIVLPQTFAQGGPPGGRPPAPVGVTEARTLDVRQLLQLSGSVHARRQSVVAAEVAGKVVSLGAREGDFVRRGATLATLRREALELVLAAEAAALKEAEARLSLADQNLERAQDLEQSKIYSRQDLDAAVSERTAWLGRVEASRARIAQVQDDLDRSLVSAPFTGFVVDELTEVGEWVSIGGPVMELVDLENPEVVLEVPERYFGGLETGTAATVRFDGLPDTAIDGEVVAVIPSADERSRTLPVKVRFSNADHRVAVGMLAQVSLPVGEARPALAVPKDAIVRQGPETFVFTVGPDGSATRVAVATGGAAGQWIEVRGDLAAGDRVVTRGNERLQPGQPVAPSPVEYELP